MGAGWKMGIFAFAFALSMIAGCEGGRGMETGERERESPSGAIEGHEGTRPGDTTGTREPHEQGGGTSPRGTAPEGSGTSGSGTGGTGGSTGGTGGGGM